MTRTTPHHAPALLTAGALVLLTMTAVSVPSARAAEFFVNNASASCSPSGPGTIAAPFCTITAALAAHHAPGDIITVMPGVYREQVTVPASGVAGSPITLRAQPGAGAVVVDGTNDFSDPALWTQSSGDVWVAASVTTAPKQVFADDQRLAPSAVPPASLPARSFTFVAGSGLFVNAGGGNPGTHHAQVGSRVRGFFASGKSFIVIRGFTVTRGEDRCIQLTNSSNVLVDGNTLTFSGGFGLQANGDSADRIVGNRSSNHLGHGFSFINRTVETTLENNEAFANADPNTRVANGVFVGSGSARNVIRGNRWHDNQDSGEQFSPGAVDNVSIQNRSWANGDHGFDHNGATGTVHVNEVAFANFNDGFSIEGTSTGTRVFNSIAIENGTKTNGFDLFVDSTSTVGLESNDNVLWNSGPQPPVRISQSVYASVSGYAAGRNQDTRTIQDDPKFVNAVAGDFQLTAGSPAIDDANSGAPDWSSTDAEGHARSDDAGTPNRGLGPVTFADRGALEFQGQTQGGTNQPPVARLTATPATGPAPLNVTLDASTSSDADGSVVSYFFAFGDGNTLGPQSSPVATHAYGTGNWTATVTVTDDKGATNSASAAVNVTAPAANQPPVAALTAKPSTGSAPLRVHLNASQSSDPEGAALTFRFDFGDGTSEGPKPSPEANHEYAAGPFTATVTVTDDHGATATATASIVVSPGSAPPAANLVANGSFEANSNGWVGVGGASIRRVAGGHSGGFSLLASAPLIGLTAYGIDDQPNSVPHADGAGSRYHVRAWVRAELGVGLMSLDVRESKGRSSFSFRSSSLTVGTAWTALDLDVTTHISGSALDVSILNAPSIVGTAFRIDDVSVVAGGGVPGVASAMAGDDAAPEPTNDPMLAPGVHPNPMRADGARIVFTTATAGPTEVAIFDLSGRVVRRLAGDPGAPAGVQFVAFDGRSADGRRLPGGVYYYQVRAPGTASAVSRGRLVIVE